MVDAIKKAEETAQSITVTVKTLTETEYKFEDLDLKTTTLQNLMDLYQDKTATSPGMMNLVRGDVTKNEQTNSLMGNFSIGPYVTPRNGMQDRKTKRLVEMG